MHVPHRKPPRSDRDINRHKEILVSAVVKKKKKSASERIQCLAQERRRHPFLGKGWAPAITTTTL